MKTVSAQLDPRLSLQAAVLLVALLWGGNAMSLEQPQYTVLYKDGDVEYRQYEPYLVSETLVAAEDIRNGGYKDAGNEGFKRLFRYITGANQNSEKIAMTAPVEQQKSGEKIAMTKPVQQQAAADGYSVSFMLPTRYTLETAPVPTDPRVQVRQVPGRLMAVMRYSGRWTEKNFAKRKAQLAEVLDSENIEATGTYKSALYNAPYVPPFMRRNEVKVAVNRLPENAVELAKQQMAAY
jgi:hypothetical protein